jgi:excisionase family DNA binding protein
LASFRQNPGKNCTGSRSSGRSAFPEFEAGGERINPEARRWLSVREGAAYLGLNLKTVYSLIQRREIPAAKIGGSVRIDKKSLEAQLEAQLNKARAR